MTDIYLVRGQCGEYSDRSEWTVMAFVSEEEAKAFLLKVVENYQTVRAEFEDWDYWEQNSDEGKAAWKSKIIDQKLELGAYRWDDATYWIETCPFGDTQLQNHIAELEGFITDLAIERVSERRALVRAGLERAAEEAEGFDAAVNSKAMKPFAAVPEVMGAVCRRDIAIGEAIRALASDPSELDRIAASVAAQSGGAA